MHYENNQSITQTSKTISREGEIVYRVSSFDYFQPLQRKYARNMSFLRLTDELPSVTIWLMLDVPVQVTHSADFTLLLHKLHLFTLTARPGHVDYVDNLSCLNRDNCNTSIRCRPSSAAPRAVDSNPRVDNFPPQFFVARFTSIAALSSSFSRSSSACFMIVRECSLHGT